MDLNNNVAVITGAASGMGAAAARLLAEHGARVVLIDQNEMTVNTLATELGGLAFACDVSDANAVSEIAVAIKQQYGAARIAINCAGIAPAKRIVGRDGAMPLVDFQRVIDVNLIGSFNVMRIFANEMTQLDPLADDECGVIINTASVAAYEGQIGQAAYSASKGGIVGLTLPAARELAQFGIRVMTIAPGLVATPMLLGMPQKVRDSLSASVPFPKRLASADEFANLVQHIIENVMLNGSVIRLDGAIRLAPR